MIIACLLVACGSSVYVQKKSSLEEACSFAGGGVVAAARRCVVVAVATDEDIVTNVCEDVFRRTTGTSCRVNVKA